MTHDSSDIGTIAHLPECIHPQQDYPCAWCQEVDCECPCICDRLRACEQRVRESAATMWDRTDEQMADSRRQGWNEALDAAREAVTRTCHHTKYEGCRPCTHDDAIRAIETL